MCGCFGGAVITVEAPKKDNPCCGSCAKGGACEGGCGNKCTKGCDAATRAGTNVGRVWRRGVVQSGDNKVNRNLRQGLATARDVLNGDARRRQAARLKNPPTPPPAPGGALGHCLDNCSDNYIFGDFDKSDYGNCVRACSWLSAAPFEELDEDPRDPRRIRARRMPPRGGHGRGKRQRMRRVAAAADPTRALRRATAAHTRTAAPHMAQRAANPGASRAWMERSCSGSRAAPQVRGVKDWWCKTKLGKMTAACQTLAAPVCGPGLEPCGTFPSGKIRCCPSGGAPAPKPGFKLKAVSAKRPGRGSSIRSVVSGGARRR